MWCSLAVSICRVSLSFACGFWLRLVLSFGMEYGVSESFYYTTTLLHYYTTVIHYTTMNQMLDTTIYTLVPRIIPKILCYRVFYSL